MNDYSIVSGFTFFFCVIPIILLASLFDALIKGSDRYFLMFTRFVIGYGIFIFVSIVALLNFTPDYLFDDIVAGLPLPLAAFVAVTMISASRMAKKGRDVLSKAKLTSRSS